MAAAGSLNRYRTRLIVSLAASQFKPPANYSRDICLGIDCEIHV